MADKYWIAIPAIGVRSPNVGNCVTNVQLVSKTISDDPELLKNQNISCTEDIVRCSKDGNVLIFINVQ